MHKFVDAERVKKIILKHFLPNDHDYDDSNMRTYLMACCCGVYRSCENLSFLSHSFRLTPPDLNLFLLFLISKCTLRTKQKVRKESATHPVSLLLFSRKQPTATFSLLYSLHTLTLLYDYDSLSLTKIQNLTFKCRSIQQVH